MLNKWIGIGVMIGGLIPSLQATNLITNPGLETGDTTGWTTRKSATLTTVQSPVKDGSFSLYATQRESRSAGPAQDLTGLLVADQSYLISADVRLDTVASTGSKITLKLIDDSGTSYTPLVRSTLNNTNWTSVSGSFTFASSGTVSSAVIYIETGTNDNFYVDNFSCSRKPLPIVDDQDASTINGLVLIDATSKKEYSVLSDHLPLDLTKLPRNNLAIRAEVGTNTPAGVRFLVDGVAVRDDLSEPFELLPADWTPAEGGVIISARAIDAQGAVGASFDRTLTLTDRALYPGVCPASFIDDQDAMTVDGLVLVDADTGLDITNLCDQLNLDLSALPSRNLSIRAAVGAVAPAGIRFEMNGNHERDLYGQAPFSLMGYANQAYADWIPHEGSYSITATALPAQGSGLPLGSPYSIDIHFTDDLRHRVGQIQLTTPANASVTIKQKSHSFPFGCVLGNRIHEDFGAADADSAQKYREVFLENFNYAVLENSQKWYHNRNRIGQTANYKESDYTVDWCEKNNIRVRGHALFWGAKPSTSSVWDALGNSWLETISPAELALECEHRAVESASRYANTIMDWDLCNETLHGDFYETNLGPNHMADMANWALQGNPNARLFFNDFGILSGGSTDDYIDYIVKVLNGNALIGGIGCQAHMSHKNSNSSAAKVTAKLDRLAELNLPIWITEFDSSDNTAVTNGGPDRIAQANWLGEFVETTFKHHKVEGIMLWGFWADSIWAANAELFNSDWSILPSGERWRELVFDRWWTEASCSDVVNGEYEVNAFAGDYEIVVNGISTNISLAPFEVLDIDLSSTPSDYEAWAATSNLGNTDKTADPDLDGASNLLEFALGLNPNQEDATGLPTLTRVGDDITYTYSRSQPTLNYEVQVSADLSAPKGGWKRLGSVHKGSQGDIGEEVMALSSNLFVRLQVSE